MENNDLRRKRKNPNQFLVTEELEAPSEEYITKRLQILKQIIDTFEGREKISSRLKPILDPENLQTSSRLSGSQVSFVIDSFWLADLWSEFRPLKNYAEEVCRTVISKEGEGRKEAIGFVGAIESSKLFEKLVFQTEVPKKSKIPKLLKKEEKE